MARLVGVTVWNIRRADDRVRLALWWDFGHVIEVELPPDHVDPAIRPGDHLDVPIGNTGEMYALSPNIRLFSGPGGSRGPTDEEYRGYGWRVRRGRSRAHYTDPPHAGRRVGDIRREGDMVRFVVREENGVMRSGFAVTLPRARFDRRIREGDLIATRITVTKQGTLQQSVRKRRVSLRARMRQLARMAKR